MKKLLKFLTALFNGAVFGAAVVIPGADSGTTLIVFGSYDVICGALALDIKHIKKHLAFLLSFALGVIAGIGGAVVAADYLLTNHPVPTYLFFIGLIAGSLPVIFGKIPREKYRFGYLILAAAGLAIAVLMGLAGGGEEAAQAANGADLLFYARLFVCSMVAATAMLMPGLSGSFLLLLFGVYPVVTGTLRSIIGGEAEPSDFITMLPVALGIIAGVVFGARLIKWLLSRYNAPVYSLITGLMLGSMVALFPEEAALNPALIAGICAFLAGAGLSFAAGRANNDG